MVSSNDGIFPEDVIERIEAAGFKVPSITKATLNKLFEVGPDTDFQRMED